LSPALADAFRRHKLCHDAHRGDADAQYLLSIHYKGGYGGVRSDLVQAYLWRTLASSARVNANIDELIREMSATQLAEAERLVAEWAPDEAECATIGAQAES
jgi:TPR repeat protein